MNRILKPLACIFTLCILFTGFYFSKAMYKHNAIMAQQTEVAKPIVKTSVDPQTLPVANGITSQKASANMNKMGQDWLFVENKGQLTDENHNPVADVSYYIHSGINKVFCKPGMLRFTFARLVGDEKIAEASGKSVDIYSQEIKSDDIPSSQKIILSNMDLELIGSNHEAKITAEKQQAYYENYYTTGDANHGITNVHTFQKLIYHDIYAHIDMILTLGKGHSMEYAFLVHPGGRVSDIKMKWNGAEKQNGKFGKFPTDGEPVANCYGCKLGYITESAPKCFCDGKLARSNFVYHNGSYGFKVWNYNPKSDLLIDPSLFATYFGGSGSETGYGVCTDGSGNIFITGYTNSSSGIATSGAYQTSLGGSYDAFLAKFSGAGSLTWATYYGTSGNDEGLGICTDGSGNVFITGLTFSTFGIATSGTYKTTNSGADDAFLAKFSGAGSLSWATYFGGSSNDVGLGIGTDGSGNVFITGYTASSSGIATSGSYQTSKGGGLYDAFLAQFGSSGSLSWATYFGGSSTDQSNGLAVDGSGNVFIAGNTSSSSGIASSGGYQTSFGGSGDAFLAKFSNAGAISWATYFGGTGADYGYGVCTDVSGNIFITGYTASTSGIASSGANQTSIGGSSDVFLAKFSNSAGAITWATYYGGSGSETGYGVCTDGSGNVYVTGYTTSSSGMATSGVYQTSNGGGTDAFLAKFSNAGALSGASYFGGSSNETAYGVSTDGSGNAFIIGNTTSSSGIATSGSYQTSINGTQDAFLAEFNIATALPVSLVSFSASLENNAANLTWQTSSEINNDYFEIERSTNGQSWENVGKVSGHGNAMVREDYRFIDNLSGVLPSCTIYYRLKQVDFNGNFAYSMIRDVNFKSSIGPTSAFPNPVSNILNLNWNNGDNDNAELMILNTSGTIIYFEKILGKGAVQKQLDLSRYPAGNYIIDVVSGKKNLMCRSIIKD